MDFDAERLRRFIKIEGHTSPQGSPQNYFFLKRADGVLQVFTCDSPSSCPKQLTFFEEGVENYYLSPCRSYLAVVVNSSGSEHGPIVLVDIEKQTTKIVLQDIDAQSGMVVWAIDGSRFLFRSNIENKRDYKIYEYCLSTHSYVLKIDCEGWGYPLQYSPCGGYLLFGVASSGANQDVYLYDINLGSSRHLTPHEGAVRYEAAFLGHHTKVLFLSDLDSDSGFKRLYLMDIEKSTVHKLGKEFEWDLSGLQVSSDSLYYAFVVNEAGFSKLIVVNSESGLEELIPDVGGVLNSFVFTSANDLLMSYQSPTRSSDCYCYCLRNQSFDQITYCSYQGLNRDSFIEPELIHYKSFDGLEIPAFLYLPENYKPKTPIPMILHFHGGPEGQFRPTFYKHIQYLLQLGIGVCAPNIRGSSGYGADYMALDDYKKRPDGIRDGSELALFLVERGFTDFNRLGIVGGSYGGFMVLSLITNAPNYFAAAVNVVGISNLVTFLKNTKPYRRRLREAEYGPLSDESFLKSISPIHKISKVRTPLLVVHGVTDPRVPISEAEQLVGEMKRLEKEVESLFFDDEGHGIRKLSNQFTYFENMIKFFLKNLS